MGLFKKLIQLGLGDNYRNTLDENFNKVESELYKRDQKINENNSDNNSRMTQIEQDRIEEDKQLDNKIDTKESESIERDNNLDTRIDDIVGQTGDSNTEIVDARRGVDGEPYNVLSDRLDQMEKPIKESEQQTANLQHGTSVINSDTDTPSPLKVEFYGDTLVNKLGHDGNFETDSNGDGVADGWTGVLHVNGCSNRWYIKSEVGVC